MDERARKTLDVEEAAQVLGLGRSAAYAAVRRGEIPSIRIGKRLLVPTDALESLLRGVWAQGPGTDGHAT